MVAAPDRTFRWRLAAIALIAAAVRLAYVLIAKQGDDVCGQPLCGDAIWYSAQAQALADGQFFQDIFSSGPAADHPPLTPVLLAPISFVVRDSILAQRLGIAAIGVLAVVLITLLARRVAGDRAAVLAGGMAALYPNLWLNDGVVMSEAPAAAATALLLLLLLRLREHPSTRNALLLGAIAGVATLARAELALLVPLVLLPPLFARSGRTRTAIMLVGLVGAAAATVLTPWTAFNAVRFEHPVMVSTNDGITLLGANCDKVYRGGAIGIWVVPAAEAFGDPECAPEVTRPNGDQSVVARIYRDAGLRYIAANIRDVPKVVVVRQARVWSAYETHQMWWYNQGEGRERIWSRVGEYAYKGLLVIAVVGLVTLRRRGAYLAPLVAPFAVVAVTATLFYGLVRFRVPAEVALVVLAAVGLDHLLSMRRARAVATSEDHPSEAA